MPEIFVIKVKTEPSKEKSWEATQAFLAGKSGLAIVVAGENAVSLVEANNNSVCRTLYASAEFAPECAKYCGRAFQMAERAGATAAYRCYAGLDCRAVPVKRGEKVELVAIVGRTFTKSENYRQAATRAASGDWKRFSADELFENVLFSASPADLDAAAQRVENLSGEEKGKLFEMVAEAARQPANRSAAFEVQPDAEAGKTAEPEKTEKFEKIEKSAKNSPSAEIAKMVEKFNRVAKTEIVSGGFARKNGEEAEEIAEWRFLFGSLLDLNYQKACASILHFLGKRYNLQSLAWLERRDNHFEIVCAAGEFNNRQMQLGVPAGSPRLLETARKEISIELRDRKAHGIETRTVRLFPVAVGGEIRSGLLTGDGIGDGGKQRRIARFCQTVASELEILRLREELARRGWLARAVQKFNENVRDIDSEDFWLNLAQIFAELMKAERSSLLIFDEKSDSLIVKAAIGQTAAAIRDEKTTLGARVAVAVLHDGKPLVVQNVENTPMKSAPIERKYKSKSFISYPIEIGGRKIGVLNLTDKTGGEDYTESDLDLLHAIVPQLAVLIDRADLKHKAGEFQQLSVTDALTGLLNRRYLEERLTEEIKRSNRHGFPMSFMMIDVDDFKSYNDSFSHPEGDKALKLVAHCLKETLRGADIAARYGGEEFSILLPQTNSAEAQIIAERVRERVEAADFAHRRVTVSVGVASCSPLINTPADIIRAADNALYEAKRSGRNNVQIYENLKNGNLRR